MTPDDVLETLRTVLRDRLANRHLDRFAPEARLNEDLHLDSILTMELFLELELAHGLAVPEERVVAAELATVADLVDLLTGRAPAPGEEPPPGSVHGEEYTDIKVHCVVSCLCDALKRRKPAIDHRPFYFGVWDAEFAVAEGRRLAYHTPALRHDHFRDWFRRLYGPEVREWYDHARSKEHNAARLLDLLDGKDPDLAVMAMVDLFHLPERENKFNQNPFPHYLMLERTADPDVLMVLDPDFRWEGTIAADRVLNAFSQPTVAGGFLFDRRLLHPAREEEVAAWFEACFLPDVNPLTAAVRTIVAAHRDGTYGCRADGLAEALRELPVLSIRKYAYEHGLAFFWRALRLDDRPFLVLCDAIEDLVQGFKALHYDALRLAQTGEGALFDAMLARLDRLDRIETRIKGELGRVFARWRDRIRPAAARPERVR